MTAHPGSKRGFFRLPVVFDSQGKPHVIRPARKRMGRQAAPMTADARIANYRKQNGKRRSLTPAQARRVSAKRSQARKKEAA